MPLYPEAKSPTQWLLLETLDSQSSTMHRISFWFLEGNPAPLGLLLVGMRLSKQSEQ